MIRLRPFSIFTNTERRRIRSADVGDVGGAGVTDAQTVLLVLVVLALIAGIIIVVRSL
jgi:hypothetical protein